MEDLPSLYTASASSTRPVRACRRRVNRRYFGSIIRCVEYPDGVYISRTGRLSPRSLPAPARRIDVVDRVGLDEVSTEEQTRLDIDSIISQENHVDDPAYVHGDDCDEDSETCSEGGDSEDDLPVERDLSGDDCTDDEDTLSD